MNSVIHTCEGQSRLVRWPLAEGLAAAPAVAYRNQFAEALSRRRPEDIASSYVYMTLAEMRQLLALALEHAARRPLAGQGLELGAGCGLLAATVAERPEVQGIFALEVCEKMAELVIPKVAEWVLGRAASKITPVVGSFDDIRLAPGTLDFAVEIDSLHHSDHLERTLLECARVLKPGAAMLCLDRCHPNSVTDAQVEEMLSQVYPPEFLAANHYPPGVKLTRRENGEHEYRRHEWEAAFKAAGLRQVRAVQFERAIRPRAALKGVLSCLPPPFRPRAVRERDTLRTAGRWLGQLCRRLPGLWNRAGIPAPWGGTVFFLEKS